MGFKTIDRIISWKLRPAAKAVLLVLAYRANEHTGQCDPSINRIAAETGLGRRTVIRMVSELERTGAIMALHQGGIRTSYVINDQCHPGTGVTAAPVPTGPQPVPTTTKTGATLAPEQEEQEEQEWQSVFSNEPRIDDTESVGPTFLLKGSMGWRLSRGLHKTLGEGFPTVDMDAALAKAATWCAANPAKRKTARGMPRFLNNWLTNAKPTAEPDFDAAAIAICRDARKGVKP